MIRECIDERQNNPPKSEEPRILLDALIDLAFREDVKLEDGHTFFVAGFHTTGLCKLYNYYLQFTYCHRQIHWKQFCQSFSIYFGYMVVCFVQ